MSDLCAPTFEGLAERLGFTCEEAGGLFELRNPFALENWTLPVLELTIVLGAVLALVYAIVRLRRHNDPTNLVLWIGAIAYLAIIEPPLYFPAAFGIDEYVDTMFAHNVFTVEFLWGRLPLYIIAIYPMMATIAFELVRALGIFRRYGAFVGALCVGFVHHAFYEIFDHLGPQQRWWEWTLDHPMAQPFLDSVPLPSVVVFATLWPMSLAFCVQFFVGRHIDAGRSFSAGQLVWRTIVIGVLASIGTAILPLPATISGGITGSTTVIGVVYAAELVALSVVAILIFARQWRRPAAAPTKTCWPSNPTRPESSSDSRRCTWRSWRCCGSPPCRLLRCGRRVTANGDPVGSLWYTIGCFVIAVVTLAMAALAHRSVAGVVVPAPDAAVESDRV